MRLLIDCDGVLADFTTPLLTAIKAPFGPHSISQFNIWGLLDEDRVAAGKRLLSDAQFWADLPTIFGAKEAMEALQGVHEVYCVTTPWPGCKGWRDARVSWLEKNFGLPWERVIMTQAKHVCSGDVFLDDKPANIKSWSRHNSGRAVLYTHSYNRTFTWPDRCTWRTFDPDMTPGILSSFQAARALRVHVSTINKWIDEGLLPGYRTPGRHRRIKRTDLVSFCRARKLPCNLSSAQAAKRLRASKPGTE